MQTINQEKTEKITMKQQLWDIIVDVSWGEVSERYFNKSRSWLSKKMNGKGFNGEADGDFTDEEKEQLRGALVDLSDRIRKAAYDIQ